jgi:hypothetical protein
VLISASVMARTIYLAIDKTLMDIFQKVISKSNLLPQGAVIRKILDTLLENRDSRK